MQAREMCRLQKLGQKVLLAVPCFSKDIPQFEDPAFAVACSKTFPKVQNPHAEV